MGSHRAGALLLACCLLSSCAWPVRVYRERAVSASEGTVSLVHPVVVVARCGWDDPEIVSYEDWILAALEERFEVRAVYPSLEECPFDAGTTTIELNAVPIPWSFPFWSWVTLGVVPTPFEYGGVGIRMVLHRRLDRGSESEIHEKEIDSKVSDVTVLSGSLLCFLFPLFPGWTYHDPLRTPEYAKVVLDRLKVRD